MPLINIDVDFDEALANQCKEIGGTDNADRRYYEEIKNWAYTLLDRLSYGKMTEAIGDIIKLAGTDVSDALVERIAGEKIKQLESRIEELEQSLEETEQSRYDH